MRETHPLMKLSPEELAFLRHWIYDEAHFREGQGAAKRLQMTHGVAPADLAILIAAAIPDTREQDAAGRELTPGAVAQWPWSHQSFRARVAEAQTLLRATPTPRGDTPVAER